jgi:hypothetical protein
MSEEPIYGLPLWNERHRLMGSESTDGRIWLNGGCWVDVLRDSTAIIHPRVPKCTCVPGDATHDDRPLCALHSDGAP